MKPQSSLKLSPNLFTPLSRTPWAGKAIARSYKKDFAAAGASIGEAWEISCDPAFPSIVLSEGRSLRDCIADHPNEMLSPSYVRSFGPNCEIMVKLLNAADPLSVQVHPTDVDPFLKSNESGKPESWLVLDAEPGAGLYLGFSHAVSRASLRSLLEKDADLRPYLQFVPVKAGDYFEIEPGVPHAIGPGVTILEPQRVISGKSGKTYRFWDWSRRYNADGSVNQSGGSPRELHIEEGLRLIDPEKQVGLRYVDTLRRQTQEISLAAGSKAWVYPANPYYQLHRLQLGAGFSANLSMENGFATMVTLKGKVSLGGSSFAQGEPGFLPYAAFPMALEAGVASDLALIIPAGATLSYK